MYNSTSSQRIGTADLKQVEYLRKLSERNRQRRIAAENTETGQNKHLKKREEGFNTYMRGANRNDKEEDVIRGNTAPSSRRQYQPSLENNNSRNYSKIKHKSAGRQRTSSPGKTTRGIIPKTLVKVDIKIGLILFLVASNIASDAFKLSSFICCKV